jgi:HMP-PP phosphatase
MHVFNDGGWFTGQAMPELLKAHIFSGFRYQIYDPKRMPADNVTKVCFCGDHDDLQRLNVQLAEALGIARIFVFGVRLSGSAAEWL